MAKYAGGCACGAIKYEFETEPYASFHCQCRQCQRATGSAHASLMVINTDDVAIAGEPKYFSQSADDGNIVNRGFCQNCGSPLFGTISGNAGIFLVHAASLDDPSVFKPEKCVWGDSKQPWDFIDPNLPVFGKML